MKVAIHQPSYIPWIPYLQKMMAADVFVYLDTVQFSKNGYQNRHLIKTPKGATWITLPVQHHLGQSIRETKIADEGVLSRHFDILRTHYRRTPGFRRWSDALKAFFATPNESLCDTAIGSIDLMLDLLGVTTTRVRSSEIAGISGTSGELVASVCQALGATVYLSGSGGLIYMREEDFAGIGCKVWVQQWEPFEYEQAYPEVGFVPNLSALDLLLNCPDSARELIESSARWDAHWS